MFGTEPCSGFFTPLTICSTSCAVSVGRGRESFTKGRALCERDLF